MPQIRRRLYISLPFAIRFRLYRIFHHGKKIMTDLSAGYSVQDHAINGCAERKTEKKYKEIPWNLHLSGEYIVQKGNADYE
jgi:hypothetical protein